jgi:hypothetical protein
MSPEFEARLDRERTYSKRAWRIVDRVLPALPSAHGFYQPHAFIAGSRRRGDRNYLQWMIYARLRAKAEGGEPFIGIPKNCEHLWGPGDSMFDASRDCTDPAAWERLREYVAKERARDRAAA